MGDRSIDWVTYLPASLLRAVSAKPARSIPWCDAVDGTMVMADLSGFTAMSERLAKLGDEGAERLTGVINSFFERMLRTATGYGGDTLTFGGDAILLLFDGDGHADRAVAASLAMLKQVERAAAIDAGDGRVKIGMSVGAHSDTFVLGAAGLADERVHLFVLGRGAEMTALAEAQAERGQLAVSAATKRLLSGRVNTAWAGDFWRVDAVTGEGHRHGAGADVPAAKPAPATERSLVPEYDLRLLAQFLPPYARAEGEGGGGRVQHEPEHRRTVIAFVNVLGLNDVIESAGIDAALDQLQTYAALLTRLAAKHHGFVVSSDIATQGSKLVITYGTPVAHEYAPANAARFALDLTAELRQSGLDLRHKIGLNGGHVFAGEVGPSFRRQYTVMGDAVNLAARLMSAAQPGETLISRKLLDYVSPDLCARVLEPIKVKGKGQPVCVCVLEEERRGGGQIRGGAGSGHSKGRLFGRRAELDVIGRAWKEVRSSAGRVILVEGDAGVGKTRLLDEALRGMRDAGRVTRVACFEHLQAAPFTPWVDALHSIVGIATKGSAAGRTETVRAYLEERLAGMVEFGPLFNPLLNVSLPQNQVVGSLDARARREQLFELIARILAEAGRDGGHVVVIEDLHWMDDASAALVGHLARHIAEAPILLLLTTRPAETASELEKASPTRLALAELADAESLAMVREALGVPDLPAEVGEALYAKTKGNPLFLEEVIHSLQAPGMLQRILAASTVTRAAELASLEIPDRVQGLLMSRIDRLAPDTREVLKVGSVVGRSFDGEVLAGIGDPLLRQVSLERAFDELVAAALVVASDETDRSLTFRHALVQDVAYESMPFARRRRLHGDVARYLESVQDPLDHAVLVHHYGQAGDGKKTRLHAARAAESSVAVYASLEAADYLSVALGTVRGRTAGDACLRSRFEELMGDSLEMLSRTHESIACFSRARRRWTPQVRAVAEETLRDLAPVEDAEGRDSLLCWKIAMSLERGLSAYKRALRWLERGEAALPPHREALAARLLMSKALMHYRLGHYRRAVEIAEKSLALARQGGELSTQAYALSTLGSAFSGLGQLEQSRDHYAVAVALFEQAGDLYGLATSQLNLGYSYALLGDLQAAVEYSELALNLFARLGSTSGVANQHMNLGGILMQTGQLDVALEHLDKAIQLRGHEGVQPQVIGFSLLSLCRVRILLGDLDAADRALAEGRAILERLDSQDFMLDVEATDARLRLAQGDLREAEDRCRTVLEQAQAMGAEQNEVEALCVLGRVKLEQGDPDGAIPGLEACIALAEKNAAIYERAQALAELAEAQALCGDAHRACDGPLCEAIVLFETMGARYDLEKAMELRARLESD